MKPFIFTVCDQDYLDKYGAAFINSARFFGHEVSVVCSDVFALTAEDRAYYVAWRFRLMPDLVRNYGSVLMVDIDSIIRAPIEIDPSIDVGLYLRDHHDPHKKVMGSAVYCTLRGVEYAERVCEYLGEDPKWCDDQKALWLAYEDLKHKYQVQRFDVPFISWDCHPGSLIWTGKGARKDTDGRFISECAKWEAFGRSEGTISQVAH